MVLRLNNAIGFGGGAGAGGGPTQIAVLTRSKQQEAGASFTLNLPTLKGGDLILIAGSTDDNLVTSFEAGYTEKWDFKGNHGWSCFAKVASGSETTVAVTIDIAANSTWFMYIIEGANGVAGIERDATVATGENTSPDPPSFPPSWGAKRNLWFGQCRADGQTPTVAPTNYTDLQADTDAGIAERLLDAASEDPGVFTIASSVAWEAITFAVEPA